MRVIHGMHAALHPASADVFWRLQLLPPPSGLPADLATTSQLMHYVVPANFLGLPALSVPVGVLPCSLAPAAASSTHGSRPLLLPVSLQIMAPCYHEASLLHAGAVLEAAVAAGGSAVPVPPVWFDVLAPARPSSSCSGA